MPRDAVSRTAHVGTVGKNGLNPCFTSQVVHVLRPLLHCGAMAWAGGEAWGPYLLALGMDVTR